MKPLDIENLDQDWDCIIPFSQISSVHNREHSVKPIDSVGFTLYLATVVMAVLAALMSSDILLAISVVFGISAIGNHLYRNHQRKSLTEPYKDEVIYRKSIEANKETEDLFHQSLDSAEQLNDLVRSHAFIRSSIRTADIHMSIWQCAEALEASDIRRAKLIATNLHESLEATQSAIESVSTEHTEKHSIDNYEVLKSLTSRTYSDSIIDSAKGLEKGAQEVHMLNKRRED